MTLTYNGEDKILGALPTADIRLALWWMRITCCVCRQDWTWRARRRSFARHHYYSPLRHWNVGKGQKVGVVGLGGLGHMGVKFAHAFGAHTVLFTTSPNKPRMRNGWALPKW